MLRLLHRLCTPRVVLCWCPCCARMYCGLGLGRRCSRARTLVWMWFRVSKHTDRHQRLRVVCISVALQCPGSAYFRFFLQVAPLRGFDVIDHRGELLAQDRSLVPKSRGVSRTMVVHVGGRRRDMMWTSTPYIQGSTVDAGLHNPVAGFMAHCGHMANEEAETC